MLCLDAQKHFLFNFLKCFFMRFSLIVTPMFYVVAIPFTVLCSNSSCFVIPATLFLDHNNLSAMMNVSLWLAYVSYLYTDIILSDQNLLIKDAR